MEPINEDLLTVRVTHNVAISVKKLISVARWSFGISLVYWIASLVIYITRYSVLYKAGHISMSTNLIQGLVIPVIEIGLTVLGLVNAFVFFRFMRILHDSIQHKDQLAFDYSFRLMVRSMILSLIQFVFNTLIILYYLYYYLET